MAIAVVISINASNRVIQDNERQRERAREQARTATCYLVLAQVRVYSESEPSTRTGREVAKAWSEAARAFGCIKE